MPNNPYTYVFLLLQ